MKVSFISEYYNFMSVCTCDVILLKFNYDTRLVSDSVTLIFHISQPGRGLSNILIQNDMLTV